MNRGTRLEGVDGVLANINRELAGIETKGIAGLMKGGLRIQRDAQKLAPVLTSNLKGSAYTRRAGELVKLDVAPDPDAAPDPTGSVPNKTVEVGFTAAYAAPVHEDLEATHTNGEAKFLEKSLSRNIKKVLEDVRKEASVGS